MSLDIFPSFHLFLQVKKKEKKKKKVSIQLNDRVDRRRRMSCALPSNFFQNLYSLLPNSLHYSKKKKLKDLRMNRTTRPFKWRHCPPEQEKVPRRSVFLTQFERKWKWKKKPHDERLKWQFPFTKSHSISRLFYHKWLCVEKRIERWMGSVIV